MAEGERTCVRGPERTQAGRGSRRGRACLLGIALFGTGLLGTGLLGCSQAEPRSSVLAALPDAGARPDAGAGAGAEDASSGVLADAGAFGFARDIHPIFVTYCGQCHSRNGPYHDIASPDLEEAYADAVAFADRILVRIAQGNMPPACVFDDAACVPEPERQSIERWVAEGLPR